MADTSVIAAVSRAEHRHGVSLGEAFRVWLWVAALSDEHKIRIRLIIAYNAIIS